MYNIQQPTVKSPVDVPENPEISTFFSDVLHRQPHIFENHLVLSQKISPVMFRMEDNAENGLIPEDPMHDV